MPAWGRGATPCTWPGKGWKVTGFDLSAEAIKSAHANAAKAGVRIDAVKASYADFDFGTAKWDLIVLTFAWAPIDDPAFVARLRDVAAAERPDRVRALHRRSRSSRGRRPCTRSSPASSASC